jgi:hypothetical protein
LSTSLPQVQVLEADSIRSALQRHEGALVQRGQALSFVTSLPCLEEKIIPQVEEPVADIPAPAQPVAAPDAPAVATPTHLLRESIAVPLLAGGTPVDEAWELYQGKLGWQLRGAGQAPTVNDSDYQAGQVLARGDTIHSASGSMASLIEVH